MDDNPIGFRYVVIEHRPDQELRTREDWDRFITIGMQTYFDQEPAKRNAVPSEIPELFDEYILYQSSTLGWRITLGTEIQRRMSAWWLEPSGPRKFKRLGDALALSAERVQGRKPARITDPDWYAGKKDTVGELKSLIGQILNIVVPRRTPPTSDSLIGTVASIVQADGSAFPMLHRSIGSLQKFLNEAGVSYAERLRKGNRVSPSKLFDDWSAWRRNYDPEHLRQEISRIGSRRK
jgi:hypothetical protein